MLKWVEMVIKLSGIPLGTFLKDIIILTADILVYLSNLSNHWPLTWLLLLLLVLLILILLLLLLFMMRKWDHGEVR